MLDDGKVLKLASHGCWVTCHAGMRDTRDQALGDVVRKHPLLGDARLKESDVRKYLQSTRIEPGASWDKTKTAEEIAKSKAAGGFLDLMQWRVALPAPVGPTTATSWNIATSTPARIRSAGTSTARR
jgi:hypothetical protein